MKKKEDGLSVVRGQAEAPFVCVFVELRRWGRGRSVLLHWSEPAAVPQIALAEQTPILQGGLQEHKEQQPQLANSNGCRSLSERRSGRLQSCLEAFISQVELKDDKRCDACHASWCAHLRERQRASLGLVENTQIEMKWRFIKQHVLKQKRHDNTCDILVHGTPDC